jgi:hypothetical protein
VCLFLGVLESEWHTHTHTHTHAHTRTHRRTFLLASTTLPPCSIHQRSVSVVPALAEQSIRKLFDDT